MISFKIRRQRYKERRNGKSAFDKK